MKSRNIILFKIALIFLSQISIACSQQQILTADSGILKGKISIGPICPVETVPLLPQCMPTAETYKAWQISVWNIGKTRIIADIEPELSGDYSIKLPDGRYVIDFKTTANRIGNNNLPIEFSIQKPDTTKLNVSIDTGIR
jgi:hypothetical protein